VRISTRNREKQEKDEEEEAEEAVEEEEERGGGRRRRRRRKGSGRSSGRGRSGEETTRGRRLTVREREGKPEEKRGASGVTRRDPAAGRGESEEGERERCPSVIYPDTA
jgi:ribonuclease E